MDRDEEWVKKRRGNEQEKLNTSQRSSFFLNLDLGKGPAQTRPKFGRKQ